MSKSFDQFRRDNIVTTLPTTLEYGKEVYYKDASGNLTLWVGHEDGSAWPAVGYKEYVALLTQTGEDAPVATTVLNTIGALAWSRTGAGTYLATANSAVFLDGKTLASVNYATVIIGNETISYYPTRVSDTQVRLELYYLENEGDFLPTQKSDDRFLLQTFISIRVYP
jgi:hypothetical protein